MKTRTHKIVMASLLAGLCCIATMIIKIPSPLEGYINLGDCIVLLSGWLLSPAYGFLATGIGSALADMFSGYIMYVPATFIVNGIMTLIVFFGSKILSKRTSKILARIICGTLAEIIMVLGYFIFEDFLYGFGPSCLNITANMVQGLVGLVMGLALIRQLIHTPCLLMLKEQRNN